MNLGCRPYLLWIPLLLALAALAFLRRDLWLVPIVFGLVLLLAALVPWMKQKNIRLA